MTYPLPVMIVPPRPVRSMSRQEEDAYYERHARPVPSWILAPFRLVGRIRLPRLGSGSGRHHHPCPAE
ncbi:hypothetical protein [Oricola sp.]|uniref:hypothetical protein n=1 Tax=Oricola sp. TaxID=1979950 RepID=UPI0025F6892F|nr:hypothetical protein [Oricola sp.]MCI5078446.1 hypothetical protein [Oricola sp.]